MVSSVDPNFINPGNPRYSYEAIGDIAVAEWDELMRAAARRDHRFDPLPYFHHYRR